MSFNLSSRVRRLEELVSQDRRTTVSGFVIREREQAQFVRPLIERAMGDGRTVWVANLARITLKT